MHLNLSKYECIDTGCELLSRLRLGMLLSCYSCKSAMLFITDSNMHNKCTNNSAIHDVRTMQNVCQEGKTKQNVPGTAASASQFVEI